MNNPTTIIYVNQAANGAKTGSSWVDAYTDLQDALTRATTGTEIWVAAGVYKPTTTSGTEARTKSFVLVEGVTIYGGFFGTETRRDQRDWRANPTTLSGAIGATSDNNDNSYHVVRGKGLTSAAVLDGFTISGGNADGTGDLGYGGGLYCDGSGSGNQCSPTLMNVVFSGNRAALGGALYNNGANSGTSSPALTNVVFSGNLATQGGGALYNDGRTGGTSSPTLTNITAYGNRGSIDSTKADIGGAIHNNGTDGTSKPILTNVILWYNYPSLQTSISTEMYNQNASPTISYSIVRGGVGNTGAIDGGGNLDIDHDYRDGLNFVAPHDPLVAFKAPTSTGNLRLATGSPAIGKGNPAALHDVVTDLDGKPRMRNNSVNIGAYQGCVIFVNQAATGAKTGSSWVDAYTDLQEALKNATAGDEIWVAKGTYKPTSASGDDARKQSFELKDLVEIYGGFTGTEIYREERDWHTNKTILSGDIGVNDEMKDNSYHVVTGNNISKKTILDGFTIADGYANGDGNLSSGGGMYLSAGSPTLQNLIICGNQARLHGGGLYNDGANPTLINVVVSGNRAHAGGALYNNGRKGVSSPTLINATISGNRADSRGGGMYNNGENGASNPTLTNVILWGNSASIQRDKDYDSHEVYNFNATVMVSYSIVQGGLARIKDAKDAGKNPALADGEYPRFGQPVHPAKAPTTEGDLRLQASSPAIKCGNIEVLPRGLACDLSGRPRVVKATVDIGAYQSYTIVYVNQAADGATKDGSSWATAYTDLQQALEQARAGDEIWVAAGVYKPTTASGSAARTKSFVLVEGVEIYGGFAATETRRDQRDWRANPTILSGAIGAADNNNDNSYHVVYGKGLTRATVLDGFTISDGNANEAGDLGYGGGLYCDGAGIGSQCSPTLRNVIFTGNSAKRGGAIYVNGTRAGTSSPRLINAIFTNNVAKAYGVLDGGGAIYNDAFQSGTVKPLMTNAIFSGNRARAGGAICNHGSRLGTCNPMLTNVLFFGNQADERGGAIYGFAFESGTSNPTLAEAMLMNNSAPKGSQLSNLFASSTISHSVVQDWDWNAKSGTGIEGSSKVNDGGNNFAAPQQSNIIYVNQAATGTKTGSNWVDAYTDLQEALKSATTGDEIWVAAGVYKPTPGTDRTISFVLVEGVAIYGGFFGTESHREQRDWRANPTTLSGKLTAGDSKKKIASVLSDHVLYGKGLTSKTVLDGFTIAGGDFNNNEIDAISNEHPVVDGAGVYCDGSGSGNQCSPTLRNLMFCGLYGNNGAALYNNGSSGGTSSPTLANVIFSGNRADSLGGAICNNGSSGGTSSPTLTNVIFSGNRAGYSGGAIHNDGQQGTSNPTLKNVILWNNPASVFGNNNQISNYWAQLTISCSIIKDGVGSIRDAIDGGHNLDEYPGFELPVNPDTAPTTAGDLRPHHVVRALATPFFSVPHTKHYDFDTKPFTILAVVSPDTIVPIPPPTPLSSTNTGQIHTGNIIAQYDPYQQDAVGWELSLIADPKGQAKGSYFSLVLFGKEGARQEYLALLSNEVLSKLLSTSGEVMKISVDVFNRYTHTIVVVRAETGACQLYLNGFLLDPVKKPSTPDTIDVTNKEPLTIGKLLADAPEEQQGGIVRKVCLWNKALTQSEVINAMHSIMSSTFNFTTKMDYTLEYIPPSGDSTDYHVRLKGVRYLDALEKQVSQSFDKKRVLQTPSPDVAISDASVKDAGSVHKTLWNDFRSTTGQELAKLGSAEYATQPEDSPFEYVESFVAESEIWRRPECVGFWTFHGVPKEQDGKVSTQTSADLPQAHNGKDLSTTSNDLPQDQCIPTEDQSDPTNKLQTVLPFYIQRQLKTQWCWASSSVSVANFYVPQSPQTQADLVTHQARELPWSLYQKDFARPLTSAQTYSDGYNECNYPYYITVGLSSTGMFSDWIQSAELKELIEKLHDVRPIVARIQWNDWSGHFVVISGTYKAKTELMVVINDPWSGMSTMTFDTLKTKYPDNGSLSRVTYSRPIWLTEEQ